MISHLHNVVISVIMKAICAGVGFGSGTETSISVVCSNLHFFRNLMSLWYYFGSI